MIVTVISALIIAAVCTVGALSDRYQDTLFQRCVMGVMWLASLAVGYNTYVGDPLPTGFDLFIAAVALWALSIFWKYRKCQSH